MRDGDRHSLGGIQISCLFTPCHTTGHICYYVTQDTDRFVFTGDTLFLGGSGRFFEGTAEMMYSAMVEKLGSLPADTKVYCGHEYSLQNLAYGQHVEPENQVRQFLVVTVSTSSLDCRPSVRRSPGVET